jgi:hypothetical protein
VARALGLRTNEPFFWSQDGVERLRSSGLFHDFAFKKMTSETDGTVTMHLDVLEKNYISFQPV